MLKYLFRGEKWIYIPVLVAALGYFVDIYDLILFSVVRVPSLKSIGIMEQELLNKGVLLLNLQMTGMLLGGIFFGILGDKLGRLSVLFGSILLYSLANLANAYVDTINAYAILRFLAGFGLAGELGAGITLVSECLPKEKRGYGTTIVAAVGVSGALVAWIVASKFHWRSAYIVGGLMGLALLLLRVGVLESKIYTKACEGAHIVRGNFFSFFQNFSRFKRFIGCILIGLPIWYNVGILVTLSPEFAKALLVQGNIEGGKSIFYYYAGLVVGDVLSGVWSQILKSRKKSIFTFQVLLSLGTIAYFLLRELTPDHFYILCFLLGCAGGYWAMFATVSAEQFGTNLRATAATTAPNFVRGGLVLISSLFMALKAPFGILSAGALVGFLVMAGAFLGLSLLQESFHKDLDFLET